jgi:hypothetical protein
MMKIGQNEIGKIREHRMISEGNYSMTSASERRLVSECDRHNSARRLQVTEGRSIQCKVAAYLSMSKWSGGMS